MKKIALGGKYGVGKFVLVDDDDAPLVSSYSWYCTEWGYAGSRVRGHLVFIHRLLNPGLPDGLFIDHINGDKLDNRRSNLRIVTKGQNGMNRDKPITNSSGFKGVSYHKKAQKWMAVIRVAPRQRYLGLFSTSEEAAAAYNRAALQYYGEFAYLNVL